MEWLGVKEIKLSFSLLTISAFRLGEDLAVLVAGGEREHVGTAVLSVPRPSLRNDGTLSSTSSVLNLPGHKDEALCRRIAEHLSSTYGRTALVTGGFHVDGLAPSQLEEIMSKVEEALPGLFADFCL